MKRRWILICLVLSVIGFAAEPVVSLPDRVRWLDLSSAEAIPVLSGGRIKPLLVAATEGTEEIRGRAGLTRALGPMRSWFAFAFFSDSLINQRVVLFPEKDLRALVGMDRQGQFASFSELTQNKAFLDILGEANEKASRSEKLSAVENAAKEAGRRLEKFSEAASGTGWRLLPGGPGREGAWRLPQEIPPSELGSNAALAARLSAFAELAKAFRGGDQAGFDRAARAIEAQNILTDSLSQVGDGTALRVRGSHLAAELALVRWHPFRVAWIVLLAAFFCAWFARVATPGSVGELRSRLLAWGLGVVAMVAIVVGFCLRVYVSGRAPVTDMYETTLWAGFGVLAMGLAIARLYRSSTLLAVAAACGCVVFLLADNLPTVLDPSIRPLVPVLRSNFWLSLHVLTVTLSYGAFLLAAALGNLGLAQEFRHGSDEFRRSLAHWTYRAIQLGVLLLTAGIVLGGVWADYSWGRFWGWDPKETWALIADLGYLAVLHGRFSGWIRTFGTLMGAVIAFFGVMMAWYGVNFILASGLHSYGFSQGGAWAVGCFAALQGLFAAVAWIRRERNLRCAA